MRATNRAGLMLIGRMSSRSRFIMTGVYDISVSGPIFNGRYLGSSNDIVRRLTQHFERSTGKFVGHSFTTNKIYRLPVSSTQIQREILEQSLIDFHGLPNLLNKNNPVQSLKNAGLLGPGY